MKLPSLEEYEQKAEAKDRRWRERLSYRQRGEDEQSARADQLRPTIIPVTATSSIVVARLRDERIFFMHAGGLEISRALGDKDPAQFNLVFDVKADGFFGLLKAATGLPIGPTVSFSSVAGRFGNSGQNDYIDGNCFFDAARFIRRGIALHPSTKPGSVLA